MAQNQFLAGVGKVFLFDSTNNLFAVCKTLSDSTFNFNISNEEIRGGEGNALWGKYFHDSSLTVSLTDVMFRLDYLAKNLGVDPQMGGIVWYESASAGETPSASGVITLTKTPVAFNGSLLVWYKKPSDTNWQVATATQSGTTYSITIAGATASDKYCIKYQYQDANTKFITIKSKYVPKVVHAVILNDLYSGDTADVGSAAKYGRIITDIPALQLDGSQDLSLSSTSAATVSLSGSALAVESGTSCEEAPYYGTMTQEIFGSDWKNDVIAIAVENADIELANGGTETLGVRVVYGSALPERKANSNFTFATESGATTVCSVSNAGVVTANGTGHETISVTLTGKGIVGYAYVTVT